MFVCLLNSILKTWKNSMFRIILRTKYQKRHLTITKTLQTTIKTKWMSIHVTSTTHTHTEREREFHYKQNCLYKQTHVYLMKMRLLFCSWEQCFIYSKIRSLIQTLHCISFQNNSLIAIQRMKEKNSRNFINSSNVRSLYIEIC